jgi:hypothetical protein
MEWFVKEVFSDKEISEFLDVLKYTMHEQIQASYQGVCDDLVKFREALAVTDGSVDVDYTISLFDCRLNIDTFAGSTPLRLEMPVPALVTRFNDDYRNILVDQSARQIMEERNRPVKQRVAIYDIQTMLTQLQRMDSDQECDATLTVEGRGGIATIHITKKLLGRLRYEIAVETAKLVFLVALLIAVGIWLATSDMIIVLIGLSVFVSSVLAAVWDKRKTLISEVLDYERKKRRGFAAN